jgi:hypothetical protein
MRGCFRAWGRVITSFGSSSRTLPTFDGMCIYTKGHHDSPPEADGV